MLVGGELGSFVRVDVAVEAECRVAECGERLVAESIDCEFDWRLVTIEQCARKGPGRATRVRDPNGLRNPDARSLRMLAQERKVVWSDREGAVCSSLGSEAVVGVQQALCMRHDAVEVVVPGKTRAIVQLSFGGLDRSVIVCADAESVVVRSRVHVVLWPTHKRTL